MATVQQFELLQKSAITDIQADLEAAVEADRILAQAAAGTATTKAGEASASSTKAGQWAENPEDTEVEAGRYSALHWAAKAAASAAGIADSAEMLVKHEAEIASLENVINSANINQETTATASGVDTIALPKTAANTAMQVQMFGQSAENLAVNGNFASGTTGWFSFESTFTVANNTGTITGTGTQLYPGVVRTLSKTIIGNNKYYARARARVTNAVSLSITFAFVDGTSNIIQQLVSPTANVWNNLSGIVTATASPSSSGINIAHNYPDAATAVGKVMEVQDVMLVNLTAIGLDSLTKEQCDILFANYFEGTDNVLGTGRVRSVGNNLIKPTYIQGFQVSTTDGTFVAGATFSRSDYFRVAASTAYILSSNTNTGTDHRIVFYDLNKVFISGATQTSGQPISITSPANAYYAIVSSLTTKVDTFRLTRGTSSFETYRESILQLTTPELRSNGLIKDEIRKGTNGYELVKRVGVGTLGAETAKNPSFTTTSDWTLDTANGVYIDTTTGKLVIPNSAGTYPLLAQQTALTNYNGKKVLVKIVASEVIQPNLLVSFGTTNTNFWNITNGVNYRYVNVTAGSTQLIILGGASPATNFRGKIDEISVKEVTTSDIVPTQSNATVFGDNVHLTLTTPTITQIAHAGLLNSNSNGTAYFEPIIADAGVYASNIAIQLTDYPIASFESIRKYANGTYTELNTATAVIAGDGLSFTHPDLDPGDLVMFTYAYSRESIGRSMTLTHYDSRFVIADTANSKVYRWRITSTNGVASIALTEV